VRPTGLVFTGVGGGNNNPGSQSVNVSNLAGMKQLSYGSSPTYVNGSNWLTYLPSNATLDTATPTRIVVQPDFTVLTPGIYRGAITLALTDGSIRTVGILSVVAPGTAAAQSEGLRLLPAAKCSPSQLQMQILTPQQAFTASLSQPVAMEVQVVDDCGTPVTPQRGAAVSASFSNSDPAVSMVHTQNGKWSGTWQPRNGSPGSPVRVLMTAFVAAPSGGALGAQTDLTVALTSGAGVPFPQSVLSAASFLETGVLAPGGLISVFGSGLAAAPTSGTTPLPIDLGGTQVTLGGQALPLLYASDGQVNAQVPFSLSVNTQLQLQVKRGSTLSVPQALTVAAAQPAVFTADVSGHGQGAIVNVQNQLVDANAPAAIGDTVVIYCTGLGAVTPAVPAGAPAPGSPLSQAGPVSVSIGSVPADVSFAGLSPGYAGLYQINAVVPAGVTFGSQVPVVVQVAGQTSPPVTIAVK
jgi:adhesin/invasin